MNQFPSLENVVATTGSEFRTGARGRGRGKFLPRGRKDSDRSTTLSDQILKLSPNVAVALEHYDPKKDHGNIQALGFVALHGRTPVVKKLITLEITKPTLDYAISYGLNPEVLDLLISSDLNVDTRINHDLALRLAARMGRLESVQMLLDSSAVPGVDALIDAAENGYDDVVSLLLRQPTVNPALENQKALRVAIQWGHYYAVETLLKDSRVDPTVISIDNEIDPRILRLLEDDDRVAFHTRRYRLEVKTDAVNNFLGLDSITVEMRLLGIPVQWWEDSSALIHTGLKKLYSGMLLKGIRDQDKEIIDDLLLYVPLFVRDEILATLILFE